MFPHGSKLMATVGVWAILSLGFAVAAQSPPADGPPAAPPTEPAAPPAEPAPWIGLRVVPVPEPLVAHLRLDDEMRKHGIGLMVINVVADGPADRAGLRRYDIVTTLDDRPVTEKISHFVGLINRHKPGDTVRLTVIRQADRQYSIDLAIGAASPALKTKYTYKYPEQAPGIYQEQTSVRSTVLMRDSSGWVATDLSTLDPAMFDALPEELRSQVRDWTGAVAPTRPTGIETADGTTVDVRRRAGGSWVVRRSTRDEAGREQVVRRIYPNLEALRKNDPEAHRVHKQLVAFAAKPKPEPGAIQSASPLIEDPQTEADSIRRTLEDAQAYQLHIQRYSIFLDEYARYLQARLQTGDTDVPVPDTLKQLLVRANQQQLLPEREFRLGHNGRVEVRIRKAAGDLVLFFANEDEMKKTYPALHEQFRQMLDGEK